MEYARIWPRVNFELRHGLNPGINQLSQDLIRGRHLGHEEESYTLTTILLYSSTIFSR